MPIDINDLEKCDIVTTSDIVKDLTPDQLIKNPHVKKLFDACNDAAHQGVDFGHGEYSSDFVSICRKALKGWEGD